MINIDETSYIGTNHNDYDCDIHIGKFSSIANGITFLGKGCEHPIVGNRNLVSTYPFSEKFGIENYPKCSGKPITIGNDVWIGENVLILDGVTIGDGVIIGAGAVVAKDIPAYSVCVGNPIRFLGLRYDTEICEKLLEIKWWDWDLDTIKERIDDFLDVKNFIEKYEQKN